jgi:uncharacterized lipoprotein YmbA
VKRYTALLRLLLLLSTVFLLSLGSCATTQQSKFYTLQALSSALDTKSETPKEERISIGVGPIYFPDYLDRPQIVTRIGPNELSIAEYDRWAGPLEDNFTRILAENLSILLATDRVAMFPWQDSAQVAYQIKVDVLQLDGTLGGQAVLIARWTIYGKDGKQALIMQKSNFSAPVKGPNYQELVLAENQTLNDLSREIASALKALSKTSPSS